MKPQRPHIDHADALRDAPLLQAAAGKSHDAVPGDYFGDFEARLNQRLEAEYIATEAPLLHRGGRMPVLAAPDGYFVAFWSRLRPRLRNQSPARNSVWTLNSRRFAVLAVAAAVALLISGIWLLPTPGSGSELDAEATLAQLSDAELAELIAYEDVSVSQLAEAMDLETLSLTDLPNYSSEELEATLEELDLEGFDGYLIENL